MSWKASVLGLRLNALWCFGRLHRSFINRGFNRNFDFVALFQRYSFSVASLQGVINPDLPIKIICAFNGNLCSFGNGRMRAFDDFFNDTWKGHARGWGIRWLGIHWGLLTGFLHQFYRIHLIDAASHPECSSSSFLVLVSA